MRRIVRLESINLVLLLLVPIMTGILLGLAYSKARADTDLCPLIIPWPLPNCPGYDPRFAGYTCATRPTYCCQYKAYNVYCNGQYSYYEQDLLAANYSLPCGAGSRPGLCLNFNP